MPAFMDRKVDVIKQRQLAPVEGEVQKQQTVEDGPTDKLHAGFWLPIDFRNAHLNHFGSFRWLADKQSTSAARLPSFPRSNRYLEYLRDPLGLQLCARFLCSRSRRTPCTFPRPDCGKYTRPWGQSLPREKPLSIGQLRRPAEPFVMLFCHKPARVRQSTAGLSP